jgi:hypothetical protein
VPEQCKKEQKERKAEERKAEQERLTRADTARSPEDYRTWREAQEPARDMGPTNDNSQQMGTSSINDHEDQMSPEQERLPRDKSPPGRVKAWLKSRFSRAPRQLDGEQKRSESGFVGGIAMAGLEMDEDGPSLGDRSASERAVALAGRNSNTAPAQLDDDPYTVSPPSSIRTSISDGAGIIGEHTPGRAPGQVPTTEITPPSPIIKYMTASSSSPTRDSRFREILD